MNINFRFLKSTLVLIMVCIMTWVVGGSVLDTGSINDLIFYFPLLLLGIWGVLYLIREYRNITQNSEKSDRFSKITNIIGVVGIISFLLWLGALTVMLGIVSKWKG